MTVVTGYWLSNWNSHPTRTLIVVDSLMKAVDVSSITGSRRTRALQLEPPSPRGAPNAAMTGWGMEALLSTIYCRSCTFPSTLLVLEATDGPFCPFSVHILHAHRDICRRGCAPTWLRGCDVGHIRWSSGYIVCTTMVPFHFPARLPSGRDV